MTWLIPTILLALAFASWRWSFRTDERLVAWCRFLLAGFLLILSLVYGVIGLLHWALS